MKNPKRVIVDSLLSLICAAVIVGAGSLVVEARRDSSAFDTLARLKLSNPNAIDERAFAEAYWSEHQDVMTSPQYGEAGRMGAYGARAHYLRYGRSEGRLWPGPRFRDKSKPD